MPSVSTDQTLLLNESTLSYGRKELVMLRSKLGFQASIERMADIDVSILHHGKL